MVKWQLLGFPLEFQPPLALVALYLVYCFSCVLADNMLLHVRDLIAQAGITAESRAEAGGDADANNRDPSDSESPNRTHRQSNRTVCRNGDSFASHYEVFEDNNMWLVNKAGVDKLKREWPDIWQKFDLENLTTLNS
jgi:hypothetical protein